MFVVENVPGAGGVVAAEHVARANPDGDVLMLGDSGAMAKPGAMSYGSACNGSVHRLTMAVFAARAGIDLLHVPCKGGSALVAALLAGEVQAGWSGIPNVASHIKSDVAKIPRERGTDNYARFMKEDMECYVQAVKAAGVRQD